jgi:hypothetical protein
MYIKKNQVKKTRPHTTGGHLIQSQAKGFRLVVDTMCKSRNGVVPSSWSREQGKGGDCLQNE